MKSKTRGIHQITSVLLFIKITFMIHFRLNQNYYYEAKERLQHFVQKTTKLLVQEIFFFFFSVSTTSSRNLKNSNALSSKRRVPTNFCSMYLIIKLTQHQYAVPITDTRVKPKKISWQDQVMYVREN